ncbi:MAG: GNAT family N-acetyltransferase [Planctomycetota bacterium]
MIRPYRSDDFDALVALTRVAFDGTSVDQNIERLYGVIGGLSWQERKARHVESDVTADPAGILVFEAEGEVVGYVSCRAHPRTRIGWIPNLAVHPEHQGRGIGRQLMAAAFDYLRRRGMAFVRIETLEQNERCRGWYPRLGFREVARQIHYIRPLDGP